MIAGLFDAYPQASSTKMIAGLFDAYSVLEIGTYKPSSVISAPFNSAAVPILADEPGLRLLSLQHNLIKRIQHLDTTFRLVFLDLYHNRLDQVWVLSQSLFICNDLRCK